MIINYIIASLLGKAKAIFTPINTKANLCASPLSEPLLHVVQHYC